MWKKVVTYTILSLWNVFCFMIVILYGAVKGPEWQLHWVSMSIFTILFLILVELPFEAAIIGFVIPSQIIPSVRKAQVQVSQALSQSYITS